MTGDSSAADDIGTIVANVSNKKLKKHNNFFMVRLLFSRT